MFQKTGTTDQDLQTDLSNQIWGKHKGINKITNLSSKKHKNLVKYTQKTFRYIYENIHPHYVKHIFGWLNPNVSYMEWIHATYNDVVYKDESKKWILIIKIPFFISTKSMDDAIRKFIGMSITTNPLQPSPHKNLDAIISMYESYHR